MMYEHFVPTESGGGLWQTAAAGLAQLADGKSAVLFCVLLGIGFSLQVQRERDSRILYGSVWRRALALGGLGFILGATIWPTEILLPMGMMSVLLWLARARRAAASCSLALLLMVPLVSANFAGYIQHDWLADGSHLREKQFGWVTLRYFIIDGNFPLIPWLVFPLTGVIFATFDWTKGQRAKHCFWIALTAAVGFQLYASWAKGHRELLPPELISTWVPTSIPFVLVGASSALAAICGLLWWQLAGTKVSQVFDTFSRFGRASLTHYLLHICLVFTFLRRFYPDEDWPVGIGLLAFTAYAAAALPLTSWWLGHFARGPVEALLALASGKSSPSEHQVETLTAVKVSQR